MLDLNAREAMHLIELRSGREGHPTYRAVAQAMHERIAAIHPGVAAAMNFVDTSQEPRLERIISEIRTHRKRAGSRARLGSRASISSAIGCLGIGASELRGGRSSASGCGRPGSPLRPATLAVARGARGSLRPHPGAAGRIEQAEVDEPEQQEEDDAEQDGDAQGHPEGPRSG